MRGGAARSIRADSLTESQSPEPGSVSATVGTQYPDETPDDYEMYAKMLAFIRSPYIPKETRAASRSFRRRAERARWSAAVAVGTIVAGWALAQRPQLLPGLTVEQAFSGDDVVTLIWSAEGTHTGAFQGYEPTGTTPEEFAERFRDMVRGIRPARHASCL